MFSSVELSVSVKVLLVALLLSVKVLSSELVKVSGLPSVKERVSGWGRAPEKVRATVPVRVFRQVFRSVPV